MLLFYFLLITQKKHTRKPTPKHRGISQYLSKTVSFKCLLAVKAIRPYIYSRAITVQFIQKMLKAWFGLLVNVKFTLKEK